MVPDLPLFLPVAPAYALTHSAPGLLTACLPIGLGVYVLFQALMTRPLLALLPDAIGRRCASVAGPPRGPLAARLLLASTAVLIGAATHLAWDAFTHRGRWGTRLVPALNATALTIGGEAVPGYKALQYGSTIVGLPLLALILGARLARRPPTPIEPGATLPGWAKAAAYAVLAAIPVAATAEASGRADLSPYLRLGRAVTTSGLALMAAALFYGLGFRAFARRGD